MRIRLDNIGIVKDSTIELNGLTVITGKNNSGKTTVGKTLYSILDAVCDMPKKAKNDRNHYIFLQLDKIQNELDYLRFFSRNDKEYVYEKYPRLKQLLTTIFARDLSKGELEKFACDVLNELKDLVVELSEENNKIGVPAEPYSSDHTFLNLFKEKANMSIGILEKMFVDIDKDPEMVDYARKSINQTLSVEFAKQIQPIRDEGCISKIELSDQEAVLFDFSIEENRIVNDGKPVYFNSPFRKVYLIDDPYILDDISETRIYSGYRRNEIEEGILNPNRIHSHSFKLKTTLRRGKRLSVFEETVLDDSLKKIKEQMNIVIPGNFEFSSEGDYYIQNGAKLKIVNLAAGSKMFSIIKMLLECGEIDESTMLILDEPEAHLHPMWQNAFAETIVMLVKELGVNILLTTHSANFMLAIDAYMRKYDISEYTNFYQTDKCEDGFVQYRCVNEDMGKIYDDFLQYLSEVKMLRNHYLHGLEE